MVELHLALLGKKYIQALRVNNDSCQASKKHMQVNLYLLVAKVYWMILTICI